MKLNNLRINTRLFSAFLACIGFLMLVAGVSLAAFSQFNSSVEQVVEKETTMLDAALTMQIYVRANSRRIMELAIAGTPDQQKYVEGRIDANRKQSDEARALLDKLSDDPREIEMLGKIKQAEKAMFESFGKVAVAARGGDRQGAIDLVNGDTTRLISVLTKGLEELAAAQKKGLAHKRDEVRQLYVERRNLVIGIALFALVAAALMAWLVARSITLPLAQAVRGAQAVAAGDLSATYALDGKDELAQLSRELSSMQTRLDSVIGEQMQMVERHQAGRVSHRIDDTRFPGVYAELVRKVNDLAALHIDINRKVISTVSEYSVGNLAQDMQALPAELADVSSAVARIKAQLLAINGEILKLSSAAALGDFKVRGDETQFQYAFREMVGGLNSLMSVADHGLTEIAQVINRIAAGDLTQKINADLNGTFAQLRDDVNRTVDQLAGIVSQINEASVSIGEASTQIAAGNTDLSSRTEEQASSLQETASSVEELTGTVKQNAENAKQANQLAVSASDVAKKGGQVVGEVVSTMTSISESARKIEDIISVIDGIAFQTNILALNAAVEAARAGEQGRGFAVVASEVRSLAQRSATAAKEIKELIGDSMGRVESGTRLVNEAGLTMEEVVKSVKRVNDIISEITAASMEQAAGIEQVNQAISQMDQTTQQNAALVEEAAAAAEAMEEQSRGLIKAVAAFRLRAAVEATASVRPRLEALPGGRKDGLNARASRARTASGGRSLPAPGKNPSAVLVRQAEWKEI